MGRVGINEKAPGKIDRLTRTFGVFLVALFGACLIGASERAEATVTATFGGTLPPSPVTFSGTNCGLGGNASTSSPNWMTKAELWIGGVKVKTVENSNHSITALSVSVKWDSTHFTHGQTVELKVMGYNNLGESGQTNRPIQDKIYNKASAFSRQDFEDTLDCYDDPCITIPTIRDDWIAMHHAITTASGDGWIRQQVLDSAKVDSALYYSTHGTMTTMEDDSNQLPNGIITTAQMSNAVANRTAPAGAGINLVFFNGCQTMTNTNHDWQVAFSIPDNAVDRAYIGWDQDSNIEGGQYAGTTFWDYLSGQQTVDYAKGRAQIAYNDHRHGRLPATLKVGGDPNTKLFGLYNYTSGWYH